MGFGAILKLLAFLLWPLLILLIYYIFNRKDFERRLKRFREKGLD